MKGFLMNDENLKKYAITTIKLLKELAKKSKKDADSPKIGFEDYNQGVIMGYYSIITLLKSQAFAFCLDQKELGLADIKPDEDLLGLHRNPDVDFGEDNWAIDPMNEEKIKGYLSDSITLLKDQAREAKQDADNSEEEKYNEGHLMAYYLALSLLKREAIIQNIDENEIGLAELDPETDLLGLRKKIRQINLSREEYTYLCKASFISETHRKLLLSGTQNEDNHSINVSEDQADEMRDLCSEQLQISGFDKNYALTPEGKILESLLDKFFE
jgi:hypothetical protein